MNRLRGVKDLVRDAVEQGATAVERIHRSSAAKPFQVLRFIPALDAPVGVLQSLQDTALAGTYGMVRWVNRAVDGTLDVALDLVEHHQRSRTNDAQGPASTDNILGSTSENV
ncbi:hypothetical protein SAMN05443572_111235 [Myxococcus fulvus]|uniref:Uncharacterized protein n=1 Tax=Myxococcus fulvus TaxID=33 RepID=A0A511TD43_MYXFU|nr:hypothetical protein [Myxococcus fulvus]AKF85468.1 hypothetical protein MFUL124B02_12975 [Myxococcus fulvus 124B02]GEN12100.1 hypothetical protein MFU01_71370 [Myxococcus fulvus]SEU36594.1 hypothetical protein SAMN05443572_111235 [Myxococcus fulvus]